MTDEEKVLAIKEFYERNYKIKFKKELSLEQVSFLYDQMRSLGNSLGYFYENNHFLEKKLYERRARESGQLSEK